MATAQTFTTPKIGSLPNQVFVQAPLPVTSRAIQLVPLPKRTVRVPVTLKAWLSAAITDQRLSAAAISQRLTMPKIGSLPNPVLLQVPPPFAERVIQLVPLPKRTVCLPAKLKFCPSLASND